LVEIGLPAVLSEYLEPQERGSGRFRNQWRRYELADREPTYDGVLGPGVGRWRDRSLWNLDGEIG
jgi:hypothetical protein